MGCFALHLGIHNLLYAELCGAMKAIKIVNKKLWKKLWLEIYSQLVVGAFNNDNLVA